MTPHRIDPIPIPRSNPRKKVAFDKKNTEVEQLKKEHSAEKEDLINLKKK